jgi:hypothetical protein
MLTPPSIVRYGPASAALARNAGVATPAATISVNAILDSFILILLLFGLLLLRLGEEPSPNRAFRACFVGKDALECKSYFHYLLMLAADGL